MPRETGANIVSWIVAGLVALGGLGLISYQVVRHGGDLIGDPYSVRSRTTTVTKTTNQPHAVTTVVKKDANGGVTETTTTTSSGGPATTENTQTAPVNDSVLERSVAGGAILLLQVGLVALAAFLVGAGVQRIILARYGIKVAGLELVDLPEAAGASQKAIDELRASLEAQVNALNAQVTKDLDAQDERARLALDSAILALNELQVLDGRVRPLEQA